MIEKEAQQDKRGNSKADQNRPAGRGSRKPSLLPVPTAPRGEVSRVDPLRRYMDEVRQYRVLSREEERKVAERFKEHNDTSSAYLLITSNLRLVVKIALEYRHAYKNVLDLIQEGNMGLMMALQKFEPAKGNRFGTYAQWWIRAYILKFLMDNFTLVKMGTTQAQRKLFYNLKREKARLEQMGIEPNTRTLATSLDVRERDIREMETRMRGGTEVSLHTPLSSEDEGGALIDVIRDGESGPDQQVERDEMATLLSRKMVEFQDTLGDRDLTIWKNRLVAEKPMTLQELGDQFGVSRERARQLEARLLQRFKTFLRREIPDLQDLDLAMES